MDSKGIVKEHSLQDKEKLSRTEGATESAKGLLALLGELRSQCSMLTVYRSGN